MASSEPISDCFVCGKPGHPNHKGYLNPPEHPFGEPDAQGSRRVEALPAVYGCVDHRPGIDRGGRHMLCEACWQWRRDPAHPCPVCGAALVHIRR